MLRDHWAAHFTQHHHQNAEQCTSSIDLSFKNSPCMHLAAELSKNTSKDWTIFVANSRTRCKVSPILNNWTPYSSNWQPSVTNRKTSLRSYWQSALTCHNASMVTMWCSILSYIHEITRVKSKRYSLTISLCCPVINMPAMLSKRPLS